jgi:ABC-2 type transport system permease protein
MQLGISCLLLAAFGWFFTWVMSRFEMGAWSGMLRLLPDFVKPMFKVDLALLASPAGQISVLYVHIVTTLVCIAWAIGMGSDAVSGQISRGTIEHLLVLPIRRVSLLGASAGVTTLGSACLVLAIWLGMALGLATTRFGRDVSAWQFLPGAVNLWAMIFCLAGITTLISACQRDRWATIKLAGGLVVLSMILKFVGRMWPEGAWLRYLSFLTPFEPQQLILMPAERAAFFWPSCGILCGIGIAGYLLAGAVLSYRDIPVSR